TTVPATARSAVAPVPRALDRSTDRVPSATQNACETPVILATATATARAAAPRKELRSQTERTVKWVADRCHSAWASAVNPEGRQPRPPRPPAPRRPAPAGAGPASAPRGGGRTAPPRGAPPLPVIAGRGGAGGRAPPPPPRNRPPPVPVQFLQRRGEFRGGLP